MSTRQMFEFVTSTLIDDTEESESAALDKIMESVLAECERTKNATVEERKRLKQEVRGAAHPALHRQGRGARLRFSIYLTIIAR